MKIRPYIASDQSAVLQLFDLNTPQYFDAAEKAGLIDYLENHIEDYYVVEDEGEIIGAGGINYEPQAKTAVISWDIIHTNKHGKGIGRKLTQHRIEHINAKEDFELIVVRTSQHTYLFYEKMGFKLLKIKKDYWADGFDLYEMEQPNKA
ncbi:GNAT family N-acetyltransferase [Marivirga sp. S37H4]|uniref:GNAT family N-acetyltransferase n=1 Tax=Marivirga aurantiaca TaxID=2802615 RepID=A0A934WZZ7_9BACT|nr:GNAT family N-acetyltransferase [Marivirga aurantiaca]MBK6266348.1 GNAT family N-acetyltransferase [Marivirga aurantiaca]